MNNASEFELLVESGVSRISLKRVPKGQALFPPPLFSASRGPKGTAGLCYRSTQWTVRKSAPGFLLLRCKDWDTCKFCKSGEEQKTPIFAGTFALFRCSDPSFTPRFFQYWI